MTDDCNPDPCGPSGIYDRRHNRFVDTSFPDRRSRGPYSVHGRGLFPRPRRGSHDSGRDRGLLSFSSLSFAGSLCLRLAVDPPSSEASLSRRRSLCRLTNLEEALRASSSSSALYFQEFICRRFDDIPEEL